MDVHTLPWYHAALPEGTGQPVELVGDEWHHARHVMRLGPGDHAILFDGRGACFTARLEAAGRQEGRFVLLDNVTEDFPGPRPYKVIIALAPTKNMDRTEFALEKITEMGVDHIVLLDCDHSERQRVRPDRLEKILLGAAKQSRKAWLPALSGPVSPADALALVTSIYPDAVRLCGDLGPEAGRITNNYPSGRDVMFLIGPEGGFSEPEIGLFKAADVRMVTLGPYRLRVETAAIAACAALHLLNESPAV